MADETFWSGEVQENKPAVIAADQWSVSTSGNYLSLLAKNKVGVEISSSSRPQSQPLLVAYTLGLLPDQISKGTKITADFRFSVTWNHDGQVLVVVTFGETIKAEKWGYGGVKGNNINVKEVTMSLKSPVASRATGIPFSMFVLAQTRHGDGIATCTIDSGDFGKFVVK